MPTILSQNVLFTGVHKTKTGAHMKIFNQVVIYENLKEIIDPSHSCLVVWDVQDGLVNRIFK